MEYPIYRKYKNDLSYFKISGTELLEELKIMGKFYSIHTIEAKILPERNLIFDLSFAFEDFAIEITEQDYIEKLIFLQQNHQLF